MTSTESKLTAALDRNRAKILRVAMEAVAERKGVTGIVRVLSDLVEAKLEQAAKIDEESPETQRLDEIKDLICGLLYDVSCLE